MPTYAIGDIQGCFTPFQKLLECIQFNPQSDTLWFTGDLVNRGPSSLITLRFIKSLGEKHKIVLGNHDLHLLAIAHHQHPGWADDTLHDILTAPDREELITWLLHRPLFHYDAQLNYALVHAGLAAAWDLHDAKKYAHEVESVLQSAEAIDFFKNMYGNEPSLWHADLSGWDRLRCITNFFTRVRFCYPDGRLELEKKTKIVEGGQLIPWFQIPHRANSTLNIIFGHWAALGGITGTPHTFALDTGCIWGFGLTAMRLEDQKRFYVDCK